MGYPVYVVSLNEADVSIFDIFEEVKLIPLETLEESYFAYPDKIAILNDTIFCFDRSLYSLHIFSPDGAYINKIHRIGRGPDEYLLGYDFALDEECRKIHILNPQGEIYTYSFDGSFIGRTVLPGPPPYNYLYIEMMESGNFITFSDAGADDSNVVNIIDSSSGLILNGYFYESSVWSTFRAFTFFHIYNNDVYYHEALDHRVYRITEEGYEVVYAWDTGVKSLVDPKILKIIPAQANEQVYGIMDDFNDGKIPYYYARQLQNGRYAYALLFKNEMGLKSIFYDKKTGEVCCFGKTTEGIPALLNMMNEEYALGVMDLRFIDEDALRNVLSPSDVELLNSREENDNHWLIKYVFKE